jgi:diketogulonate reductase-like aldo/keto reductase
VLRWDIQRGVAVIPKSVHRDRIVSNAQIFDFALTEEDMAQIQALDMGCASAPIRSNFNF